MAFCICCFHRPLLPVAPRHLYGSYPPNSSRHIPPHYVPIPCQSTNPPVLMFAPSFVYHCWQNVFSLSDQIIMAAFVTISYRQSIVSLAAVSAQPVSMCYFPVSSCGANCRPTSRFNFAREKKVMLACRLLMA